MWLSLECQIVRDVDEIVGKNWQGFQFVFGKYLFLDRVLR